MTILAAGLFAGMLLGATSTGAVEQAVEQLTPPDEQRVEVIGGGEQVEGVRAIETQDVATVVPHEPPSPAEKTASTVGKAVLGVFAAAVALGAMAASLLLI